MLSHISLNSLTSNIIIRFKLLQSAIRIYNESCSVMLDTITIVTMYSKTIPMYHVASHNESYVAMKL